MLDCCSRGQCHLYSIKDLMTGGLNHNRWFCTSEQIPTEASSYWLLPTEAHGCVCKSKSRDGHMVCGYCLAPSQAFLLHMTKSALFWQAALGVGREVSVSTVSHLWYLWSLPCSFSLILLFWIACPTSVPKTLLIPSLFTSLRWGLSHPACTKMHVGVKLLCPWWPVFACSCSENSKAQHHPKRKWAWSWGWRQHRQCPHGPGTAPHGLNAAGRAGHW